MTTRLTTIALACAIPIAPSCTRDQQPVQPTFCCETVDAMGYGTGCVMVSKNAEPCSKTLACASGYVNDNGRVVCLGPD